MKSMVLLIFSFFFFPELANATSQAQACSLINQIKNEMNVVASNLVNSNTTRTPAGGPYQLKKFICVAGTCEIKQIPKIKKVYEPEHPDANAQDGYVTYPDIDIEAQKAEMNILIHDYDNAAKLCFTQI